MLRRRMRRMRGWISASYSCTVMYYIVRTEKCDVDRFLSSSYSSDTELYICTPVALDRQAAAMRALHVWHRPYQQLLSLARRPCTGCREP